MTEALKRDDGAKRKWKDTSWMSLFAAIFNLFAVVLLLYTFVCSIDLLASGLKVLMGETANNIFESSFFRNPIAALMVGVVGTVLMQSSSTSTAIIVTLVSTQSLKVKQAIPMVMGANIGTSVTNTLVAMGQIENKHEFERAFAGATVHDMFNWLTVIVLLPLEVVTGYLACLSGLMVQNIPDTSTGSGQGVKIPGLDLITDPFTDLIIQINSTALSQMDRKENSTSEKNYPLLPRICPTKTDPNAPCQALFNVIGWSDGVTAVVVLVLSVGLLCVCLLLLVKVLRAVFSGYFHDVITKTVNATLPHPFGCLTGYVGVLVGALLTMVVQSSSIFTSTLTPLVGLGVIELETMFPMTLGSNLGTTLTGIMAAFANDNLKYALQIALCHLLFNLSGFLLWYPLPHARKIPLKLARELGRITSNYRWFAVAYVIVMFLLAPAAIFLLSWAGPLPLYLVFSSLGLSLLTITGLTLAQKSETLAPKLPARLQTWEFLPLPFRSLEPYDRVFRSVAQKCRKRTATKNDQGSFTTTNELCVDF